MAVAVVMRDNIRDTMRFSKRCSRKIGRTLRAKELACYSGRSRIR